MIHMFICSSVFNVSESSNNRGGVFSMGVSKIMSTANDVTVMKRVKNCKLKIIKCSIIFYSCYVVNIKITINLKLI